MTNEVQLTFKEGYISTTSQNGSYVEEKVISYDQVRNLFGDRSGEFDSGILPGEHGVRRIVKQNNGVTHYFYTEPARLLDVKYSDGRGLNRDDLVDEDDYYNEYGEFDRDSYEEAVEEEYQRLVGSGQIVVDDQTFRFTSPILMLYVSVRTQSDGTLQPLETRMYALKQPILTGNEVVYMAPFNNIYQRSNKICWGHNHVNLPTAQAIQGISNLFFNALTNNDLDDNRIDHYTRREPIGGRGFKPIHLHLDVNNALKDGSTPEEMLAYTHTALKSTGQKLNDLMTELISGRN